MMTGLRIQMVCLMLLAFSCCGMCTDSEEEMKTLDADVLSNMYSSKVNKARLPYWKMTLLNVCNLINNLNTQAEETGDTGEDDLLMRKQYPTAMDGFNLEAMLTTFQLQKICQSRVFQHWELIQQDYLDSTSSNSENEDVVKRKSPYIFKRQAHISKARRPYILKRATYY
ncbi:PREDICTED: neurotensin/neuromedin N [Nanorana parkeri]|uniref:neurotensin/neuromedin N n=1 Tax=Nanorana parkeri TaxID=125878 RepID=UPI000854EE98|nr:PREDICTED: neurotensin/neuromedin N [Nanorana parkeri]